MHGFDDTFLDAGEVRLHAVVGGEGPPLLLVPGWPQSWFAWRLVMPALAASHRVIAIDPRGIGDSTLAPDGYDTGTLARDLLAAMRGLGHERFSLAGHDVGMWIGFALAADHPGAVEKLILAEAIIPGLGASPPLLGDADSTRRLWHFGFNRLDGLNEQLVSGREHLFVGHQFATKAAQPFPDEVVATYAALLARSPEALRCSFAPYRALEQTMAQNAGRRLHVPVLAVGGATSMGARVATALREVADDVTELVLDDCGHFPAEERPDELAAAMLAFLQRTAA